MHHLHVHHVICSNKHVLYMRENFVLSYILQSRLYTPRLNTIILLQIQPYQWDMGISVSGRILLSSRNTNTHRLCCGNIPPLNRYVEWDNYYTEIQVFSILWLEPVILNFEHPCFLFYSPAIRFVRSTTLVGRFPVTSVPNTQILWHQYMYLMKYDVVNKFTLLLCLRNTR